MKAVLEREMRDVGARQKSAPGHHETLPTPKSIPTRCLTPRRDRLAPVPAPLYSTAHTETAQTARHLASMARHANSWVAKGR